MTRINEFGQPIGAPVPDWAPRPATEPEELVGSRVRLERLRPDHARVLHGPMVLESSPRIWTYYPYPDLTEPRAFEEYVASLLALPAAWPMAILTPDGAGRGVACYLRKDPANGSVEVGGIVFAEVLQRTAAATEAMYLMLAHAFDDLGYRRFEWKCDSANEPSRRAAVRLGFTYEGRFRNAMVYQGRNRDTDWFSITDAEWPPIKAALERWLAADNFDDSGTQRRPLGWAKAVPSPLSVAGGTVNGMDQRISFITLAVRDLGESRKFYLDGLGWEPCLDQPGEVLMFEVGDKLILSLWDVEAFTAEVGQAPGGGVPPITIAHNLATTDGVDRVLAQARAAGAAQVTDAVERDWGGYSGYFVDPDGFRWEICHNPSEIGQKVLP